MATAMQQEDKSLNIHTVRRRPEGQSVAEKRFRDIISYNMTHADTDLQRYADIWHEEEINRVKAAHPSNLWCFGVSVKFEAQWASDILQFVSGEYPKTRKFLARIIVDGWLGCRELAEEKIFAQRLREWPKVEGKLAADAIRETLEFRASDNPSKRIGRFFRFASPIEDCNTEVAVTMMKAAVKWMPVSHVIDMGKLLFVLLDSKFSENDGHLRRVVLEFLDQQIIEAQ
jgi:hypothetical protein